MSDMDLPLAVRMMQDGYLMQIDALQDENEKLRARIKELEECIRGDADGIYRLAKNTGYLHTDELMESIHNRMRELGVEV